MFIICVKSSHQFGMGHLVRSINLYKIIKNNQKDATVFLLGKHQPSIAWLQNEGIRFEVIEESNINNVDWESEVIDTIRPMVWVNDRLNTGIDHASNIKNKKIILVTFDDGGSGARISDLNVFALAKMRAEVAEGKKVLTGVEYLVLSDEINRYRRVRDQINSIVVSLGGSDTHGVTPRVIEWLNRRKKSATVILGPGFQHQDDLDRMAIKNISIKRSLKSLHAEFYKHDLLITGGGLTAFEAAAAGLPTITIANEKWEIDHAKYLERVECSVYSGRHNSFDLTEAYQGISIRNMSQNAMNLVKPDGGARVLQEILSIGGFIQ
jgi:spore coat polysaccharide biosynthesis predicted glycosyltransferase SpsG